MPDTIQHSGSFPAIVIGAGQAGVALSYCLQERGVDHLVFERDRPFADWHQRRWDSFAMNTPNWMNDLPGARQAFAPAAPRDAYGTLADARQYFDAYLRAVRPPLRLAEVHSVGVNRDGSWQVTTNEGTYNTRSVAICTGHANHTRIPAIAGGLPSDVRQLHSSQYQRPSQITTPNVLVVGSGSSGVQICQELAASQRFVTVTIAESGNFTLPWSLLGIPTYTWLRRLGVFKITRESWLGSMMFPKLLHQGDPATPPSVRQLTKTFGVRRMGRVEKIDAAGIHDARGQVLPLDDLTVVWCTGFHATYPFLDVYVKEGVLDDDGLPIHQRGVVAGTPGLYFVGLRFQHTFVSQDLYGVGPDAAYIAEQIAQRQVASPRCNCSSSTVAAHAR